VEECELIEFVEHLGLPASVVADIVSQIEAAPPMTACDVVKLFVKVVKAHIGHGLSVQQAQVLLAIAGKIAVRLSCPL
jgi:hypothetical protein